VNVTSVAESPGLKTPTLVRNPAPGPRVRTEVSAERTDAFEASRPGMNMPTVGVGAVE